MGKTLTRTATEPINDSDNDLTVETTDTPQVDETVDVENTDGADNDVEPTITLYDEVFAELKIELQNENDFDEDALGVKVKGAIREVKQRRNYGVTNYTEEQINADLYGFYSNIMNIARYDYNQIGAEGEKSHTENGLTRSYVDRKNLFSGVIPFAHKLK